MNTKYKCPLLCGRILPTPVYSNSSYIKHTANRNQYTVPFTSNSSEKYSSPDSHKSKDGPRNELDNIKYFQGINTLKSAFCEMVEENFENAVEEVNDDSLTFGCLFELKSETESPDIFERLSVRNKIALAIMDEILENKIKQSVIEFPSCHHIEDFHATFKWIFITGFEDDGLNDEFDRALDAAAAFLIKEYSDNSILPVLADLIFKRNRKGSFYNDLLWLLFESRCRDSLFMIGIRLQSPHPKDRELANALLSFIPGISTHRGSYDNQYWHFRDWLEENYLFLHYTGESLQQSANPVPYRVVPEAKYLCKVVSADTGSIIEPLSEDDVKLLDAFQKLSETDRLLLSDFSYLLHKKSTDRWNIWLHFSVSEQIYNAKMKRRKTYD